MKEEKVWAIIGGTPKEVSVVEKIGIPIFNSLFIVTDEEGKKYGVHKSNMYRTKEDAEEYAKPNLEKEETK